MIDCNTDGRAACVCVAGVQGCHKIHKMENPLKIEIRKLTGLDELRRACEATMRGQESKMTLDRIYRCEHSPIRTQLFWAEMIGIPTFVSVHFVRHKIGVEHYVTSNRVDRGGNNEVNRLTPVNHAMLLNAQTLIQMSRKRLCGQASKETTEVWQAVKEAIAKVDPDLAKYMVRECKYRNGRCPELKCCGNLYKPQAETE